jgi:rfaE bifunctional protein kinase chain/domain/rfaE bifunctional protein nucleotidyltransferase chain/domain
MSSAHSKFGFSEKVTKKIVDPKDLIQLIGKFPRSEKIVMCHGTFDLVHPGHLRHLAFAKSRADKLVVSLTADKFVHKANNRPYVPEDLRALNLASLELVDFVVIDDNAEPIELIKKVQPEYFVKGFEYSGAESMPAKTKAEKEIVESYGGEIVFSPGDFVLSSSAVIENDPPNIAIEKLMVLMQAENINFDDLRNSLSGLENLSVEIVGDLIVDSLTTASIIGGHRKTPTPSVRVEKFEKFVGGAGIVAKHVNAAGVKVILHSVIGDDEIGKFAIKDLEQSGVKFDYLIDKTRPTTHKNAVLADGYRLIRIDEVNNSSINSEQVAGITSKLKDSKANAIILSDFRHGMFNKSTIPQILNSVPNGTFKVADSQVASRWGNILDFPNCDLITPNEQEVRFALADQDTVIRPLGTELMNKSGAKTLMLKLGARGMLTFRTEKKAGDRPTFFAVDALVRDSIIDPVGSGDALLAYSTIVQLKTNNEVLSSIIGTIAAGLACQKEGNVTINPVEIISYIDKLEKMSELAES